MKKEIFYWVKGKEIWSCLYERFNGKCCKVFGSEKLIKKYLSEEEAKKELEKLRKKGDFKC